MRFLLIIFLVLFCNTAHAIVVGECKSSDGYYKNIVFKAEDTTSLEYAKELHDKYKGVVVHDKDEDVWTVIYNENVTAPETTYQCIRITEE